VQQALCRDSGSQVPFDPSLGMLQSDKTSQLLLDMEVDKKLRYTVFFSLSGMSVKGKCEDSKAESSLWLRLSSLNIFSKYSALYTHPVSNSANTTSMTMNANLQKKCLYGDPRCSFLVSLGKEKQIIPYTQEMNSNFNSSKSTELAHEEIAVAFGLPHNALFTMTYIDKTGKEAVFPLCVIRLGSNVIAN
jgi:hypothetical protein